MKTKYALPIIRRTTAEVFDTLARYEQDFDYFELWLDLIEDLTLPFVDHISSKLGGRALFLFRRPNFEPLQRPAEERRAMLALLARNSSLVDLDIAANSAEFNYLAAEKLTPHLIASYHNYHGTPPTDELREIVIQCQKYAPTMIKLATLCASRSDALRLLELMLELTAANRPFIIIGMGEHGIITRVFGSLWGNQVTFAPAERGESSAPGQLTRADLAQVLALLEKNREQSSP